MKKIRSHILLLLVTLASFTGCKKTDFAAQQQAKSTLLNVGDYIRNNFNFTLFAAALEKTGMMDSLNNGASSYTVFVPDDNAFHVDSILSISDLDKFSVDSLRFIVKSHIMHGKLFYSDIPLSMDNLYPNLNGSNLYISSNPNGTSTAVSGAPMEYLQTATTVGTVYDIPMANGVIHILSRPMKYYSGTVQDFLATRPELSIFVSGLKRFGLWDSLGKASPYTILAPVNQDFSMNNITPDSISGMDTSRFRSILFGGYVAYPHHIFISDENMVSGVPLVLNGGYSMELGYEGVLLLAPDGSGLGPLKGYSNASQRYSPVLNAGSTDFLCSNGIVHLLGQLLVLPADVVK